MAHAGILDALVTLRTRRTQWFVSLDLTAHLSSPENIMLPLPPIRTSTPWFRLLARRIDAHTLWAFNPQRPLNR